MLTRIRHKDDMWSSVFGGAMAGVALGLRARSFAVMAGSSSLLAGVMVLKGLAGNSILGPVGEMNPQQRKKWNEGFWSKPEYVPGRKMLEGKQE
ncbi:hypothetical protein BKA69DRAFT_1105748 [Paraphysoderma sedebokerense]|nr:hypothetical protein BKA69DRAFT_1105748 [Paraphysoderma sedebokerense]